MIVKITYSSELEDVPKEVAKILLDLEKQIAVLSKSLGGKDLKEGTTDVKTAVSKLEHTLSSFEALEAKLKDCHAILNGFLGVKEKQEAEQQEKTPAKEEQAKQTKKT